MKASDEPPDVLGASTDVIRLRSILIAVSRSDEPALFAPAEMGEASIADDQSLQP